MNFDDIHKVELTLLDGQIELILRAMELYGYNLEYMLNGNAIDEESKEQKIAMLKFTYEQIQATKAEQISTQGKHIEDISELGKVLLNDLDKIENEQNVPKLHII